MRLVASKQKAFEARLGPHVPALYKRAYHLTHSEHDAQELVQELLLRLYEKEESWRDVEQVKPWAMRALFNLFVDHWRKLGRNVETLPLESEALAAEPIPATPLSSPEQAAANTQLADGLLRAIKKLKPEHQHVIVMHEVEGASLAEIQQELGLPIGTIKSRLHRARSHLKRLLNKWEPATSKVRYTSEFRRQTD